MNKHLSSVFLIAAGIALAAPALAGTHDAAAKMQGAPAAADAAAMTDGEVKKVDKEAGKITIKHGPLVGLGMPAMTMVFRAKDPSMLEQVKQGDKIRFVADKVDGAFTVTKLENAK